MSKHKKAKPVEITQNISDLVKIALPELASVEEARKHLAPYPNQLKDNALPKDGDAFRMV